MEKYQPISCSFYDRLEEAATLARVVDLHYYNESELVQVAAQIKSFKIQDKVEFMILADGQEIRLDRIHSLDGVALKNHC